MPPPTRKTSEPQYRQLAASLREAIEKGLWPEKDPLPAVSLISQKYQVTAVVVRKALKVLEDMGYLEDRGDRGLFPHKPRPSHGPQFVWNPAEIRLDLEGTLEIRVLSKTMTTLPREYLRFFEVHGRSGHQASRITKLHLVNGQAKALETIYAPCQELPGLLMKDHRHGTLFEMVDADYRRLTCLRESIEVRPLSTEEAKILGSAEDFPALVLFHLLRSESAALALVEWVIPGGRCSLVHEMPALKRR